MMARKPIITEIQHVHDALESTIAMLSTRSDAFITRGEFVTVTDSTQDLARAHSNDQAGLVVVAGRQTNGRGRLGRQWADTRGLGVAATFVLDAKTFNTEHLALMGALAAHHACTDCMLDASAQVGIRWPNDIVERTNQGSGCKVAGVLVEVLPTSEGKRLAYLGIGINVAHQSRDWPEELKQIAVSLHELGSSVDRAAVVRSLINRVQWACSRTLEELAADFAQGDVLKGTYQGFVHDGKVYEGEVVGIDPASAILLRTQDGGVRTLPALTTSLIKT